MSIMKTEEEVITKEPNLLQGALEDHALPETKLTLPENNVCETEDEYELVYHRPVPLLDVNMHYCPGCAHSLVHKLLMEVVEEMNIQDKTVGVAPVGCAVFAYDYMNIDMTEAAHGRAPQLPPASSGSCRTNMFSLTRATAIWQRLVLLKHCMPSTAEKTS